jgi:hypothetical protein
MAEPESERARAHKALDDLFDKHDTELHVTIPADESPILQARVESWYRGLVTGLVVALVLVRVVQYFGGAEIET